MQDSASHQMDDSTCPLLPKPTAPRFRGINLHHAFERACRNVRDLATMDRAVLLSFVASIGNLLQGWDNASIAGAMFYIKEEFNLQSTPIMEGLIMASALFGATITTTFSGTFADAFGRWRMLLASAVSSFISDLLVIFLSQHVYMLLFTRTIKGLSIGLAVTHVPLYITETAPSDIRGKLNTFPQLSGSAGMFLSYCIVFWMSLMPKVDWRIMLGIQSIPSLIYFVLIIFYLPETPTWLVSQGKVDEAERVLQRLRRTEDVSGEMAGLFEGTYIDHAPCLKGYLIGPNDDIIDDKLVSSEEIFKLYGIQEDFPYDAYSVKEQSTHENAPHLPRRGSCFDPIVSLIGSVHESFPEVGNIFSEVEQQSTTVWDEENQKESKEHVLEHNEEDVEIIVYDPLICRSTIIERKDLAPSHGSDMCITRNGIDFMNKSEPTSGLHISGEWKLAWKLSEGECSNEQMQGGMERVYLHEGAPSAQKGSKLDVSLGGQFIQDAALMNKSVFPTDQSGNHNIDLHSSKQAFKVTKWTNLLEPGVKRALIVGVGIQVLQQFAGINGILYYTPQILEQAGVGVLLSKIGLSSSSVSILISALTALLMLPFIGIAMSLMDHSGRRRLLLVTIPILLASLVVLVIVNIVNLSTELHAVLSTISVSIYLCFFVMGFGPIPNILCAEIFPTRVRAICLTICNLTFWICDIIITYTLPVLMRSIGPAGVFGIFAVVCVLALLFVYLKVLETKGIPLEAIAEIYAKQGHPKQDTE